MTKKRRADRQPGSHKQPPSKRPDFLAQIEELPRYPYIYAGAILIFTIVLFSKFIFSSQMLYGSDTIQAGIFFRSFMINFFKAHHALPMWDPYIFCGMPFVDAFHGDIFYLPTFILKLIFPIQRALGWGLILHIYFSGIFAYMCARGFGLSRLASSFAGVAYMFSGYLVSMVSPGHDGKIFVTSLFPLAFHFLNKGTLTYKLKYFVLMGIVLALIILTPHPQMAYFSLWALGGFCVYRLIFMLKDKAGIGKTGLVLAMFVLAVVIGLFGSAIQFYPGYKYISEFSPRAGEGAAGRSGYEWAISWSMHLEELIGEVIPGFAGVDNARLGEQYWGRNPFKDNSEYIGFFTLLLAVIAVSLKRNREVWFLLGMAVFALIYALGGTTPIFRLFFWIIPNVGKMRAPSMIMFLCLFSTAMLAAYGIDALTRLRAMTSNRTRDKLISGLLIGAGVMTVLAFLFTVAGSALMNLYTSIFYHSISSDNQQAMIANVPSITVGLWVVAVFFWVTLLLIRGYIRQQIGRIALAALVFICLIDLWRIDFGYIAVIDYNRYFPQSPVLQNLKSQSEIARVFDLTRRTYSSRDYFALNGVEQMAGYHGAQLKSFDEYIGGLSYSRLVGPSGIELRPFQLSNTKYLILDAGRKMDESSGLKKIYDQEVAVYEIPRVMRRAAIYHAYELAAGDTTDLDRLFAPSFPAQKVLLLNEDPEFQPVLPDSATEETVTIVNHDVDSQKYDVTMASAGLLFVSDNYFPAWKVNVDGVETTLLKADHTFRAVSLAAGKHEVEFHWYWPRYNMSKLVTWLTGIFAVLLLTGCLLFERFRGREAGA
jgi:hypothetical protein